MFQKANKTESKLRLALTGPSGSGKTYSALSIAQGLANGGKIAVLDTERGSASKYADLFDFDVCELESFAMEKYIEVINGAAAAGYAVLIIDSLSHAWNGKDGALEMVDKIAKRNGGGGNSFAAWKDVTPVYNRLLDTILSARLHIIATMRTKTEYVIEQNERGKSAPRKVGLAPVQRGEIEYEFDVVGDINLEHEMIVTKTRCSLLTDGVITKPGKELGVTLRGWLSGDTLPEIKEIAALAPTLYGDEWQDRLAAGVEKLTGGATTDYKALNRSEAIRTLEAMRKRQAEQGEGKAARFRDHLAVDPHGVTDPGVDSVAELAKEAA